MPPGRVLTSLIAFRGVEKIDDVSLFSPRCAHSIWESTDRTFEIPETASYQIFGTLFQLSDLQTLVRREREKEREFADKTGDEIAVATR